MIQPAKVLRVLVACECSGVVRRAFRALGHHAWSCDLAPAEDDSPYHFQGDAIHAVRGDFSTDWARYTQPWEHGHPETKKTGLYLFGLPALKPSNVVYAEMMQLTKAQRSRVHYASPGPNRTANRSRTLTGIGKAMASQWSEYLLQPLPRLRDCRG